MVVALTSEMNEELEKLIDSTYKYFSVQANVVYLPDLIEFAYWDYYQLEHEKLLDAALDRHDNEIYNLNKDDFVKQTRSGELDVPHLEPNFRIADFLYILYQHVESKQLCILDYDEALIHSPLEVVW